MQNQNKSYGFSLIELLIVMSIAALVIIALTIFVGTGFRLARQNFEQFRMTENVRHNIERISMAVKNARSCNGVNWLDTESGADTLQVFTDIDDDADPERVTYSLSNNDLTQTVDVLDASCNVVSSTTTTIAASAIYNHEKNVTTFQYYDSYAENAAPVLPGPTIKLVSIALTVDVDPNQYPNATTVSTKATPRNQ